LNEIEISPYNGGLFPYILSGYIHLKIYPMRFFISCVFWYCPLGEGNLLYPEDVILSDPIEPWMKPLVMRQR
jgi:hypothetical protein